MSGKKRNKPTVKANIQRDTSASSVYYKSLRQLGIATIGLTFLELAASLSLFVLFQKYRNLGLAETHLLFVFLQYAVEFVAGIAALVLSRRRNSIRFFYRVELISLILVIAIKTAAFCYDRNEYFLDTQLFFICLILYSIRQLRMDERNQKRINSASPTVLDLKLTSKDQWFNPLIVGPRFKLDREISESIDGYLETLATPAPLEINIHGLGDISETMHGAMRDVLREHYEAEIKRVEHYLETRYRRALLLIGISIVVLEIWIKSNGARDISITKIVMSNIAAFSLWQVGTVFFERKDAHARLLRATIAKAAEIVFL